MRTETVLVVDDEPEVVDLLACALEKAGLRTVAARDGQDALSQVEAESPSLAVIDIMMPRVHGFELCRRLRADDRHRSMKIIISSAKRFSAKECAQNGLIPDGYLVKPYDPKDLISAVDRALEN